MCGALQTFCWKNLEKWHALPGSGAHLSASKVRKILAGIFSSHSNAIKGQYANYHTISNLRTTIDSRNLPGLKRSTPLLVFGFSVRSVENTEARYRSGRARPSGHIDIRDFKQVRSHAGVPRQHLILH
ncbi:hypothetical protein KM043_011125 [Ampulex compressa]|nr:hypothetical protein KM043_011125 [Ampulex compressa]